jgi:arsenate reductase-like glutaredoxin family protein
LRDKGIEADEINFAKNPLDEATIRSLVDAAGGVPNVINARHETAKTQRWADKPPTPAAFAKAAAAEPNLLRRPILVKGKTVLVGYDKSNRERWAKL